MDNERIATLFRQAVSADASGLAQLLAQLPTDERQQLETLLEADQIANRASLFHTLHEPVPERFPQIDDYAISRLIGRGGMGVVYEAEQLSLGRRVAVKVLPKGTEDQQAVDRFRKEARSAARLHHENIVPVFEVGEADGTQFYTMQYISGCSLSQIISVLRQTSPGESSESGAWVSQSNESDNQANATAVSLAQHLRSVPGSSPRSESDSVNKSVDGDIDDQSGETLASRSSAIVSNRLYHYCRSVARIGVQVAGALSYAHNQKVIHRDIKPSNLLMDADGRVWVSDFGLVKTEESQLTQTGDFLGTLRYMSPERFVGECDVTGDVYSLGITLYEMLARRPAFASQNQLELLDQIKNDDPEDLRHIDSRIPRDLATIVSKAIQKEPTRRYSKATEFADDLQRFVDGRPILARKVSVTEQLVIWARRKPMVATLLGLLTTVLAATVFGSLIAANYFYDIGVEKTELANQNIRLAEQYEEESIVANGQRDEAFRNAYYADMQLAQQDWQDGHFRRMLDTLLRYTPSEDRQDVRNWEWYYLLSLTNQDERTIYGHQSEVTQVHSSRDGKRVYSIGKDGTLRVWSELGEELPQPRITGVRRFSLSPDGKQLATVAGDSALSYWDARTGQLLRRVRTELASIVHVDWSEQANRIVVVSEKTDDVPIVLDSETDEVVLTTSEAGQHWAKLSPDGKYLATLRISGGGKNCAITDLESGKIINYLPSELDGDLQVFGFDWHPDGERFVTGSALSGARVFRVDLEKNFAQPIGRFNETTSVESVAFSADGSRILTGDRSHIVRVYDTDTLTATSTFKGHLGWVRSVDWHSNETQCWSAGNDGSIKLWNTAPSELDPSQEGLSASGSSPDGKWGWNRNFKTRELFVRDESNDEEVLCVTQVDPLSPITFMSKYDKLVVHTIRHVKIWDTNSWRRPPVTIEVSAGIRGCQFDVNGRHVVVASRYGSFVLFDASNGSQRRIIAHEPGHIGVALSPNGRQLATVSYGEVKLWDCETGSETVSLYGHTPGRWSSAVAWGNSGRYFATTGADQTVVVWDAKKRKLFSKLEGHQSAPKVLAFSKDDSRLMSVGKSTKVWDIKSGREILSFAANQVRPSLQDFSTLASQDGFELSSSALRFESLKTFQRIASEAQQIRDFEYQRSNNIARDVLFSESPSESDIQRSVAFARKAVQIRPDDPTAIRTLAHAELRSGNYVAARTAVDRALRLQPEHWESRLLKLIIDARQDSNESANRFNQAIAHVDREITSLTPEQSYLLDLAAKERFAPRNGNSSTTIVVDTLKDEYDGIESGGISLREAIQQSLPGDKIEFSVEGVLSLKYGQIYLDKPIDIVGPGLDRLTIDAGQKSRIFYVSADIKGEASVKLSGVTLANGRAPAFDGYDDWPNRGGAVFSCGQLTVLNSLLTNNHAQRGGAIWIDEGSTTRIKQCTIANNTSFSGGAACVCGGRWGDNGVLIAEDSCFSNNEANVVGGGIYSYGVVKLTNSTFHGNRSIEANGRNGLHGGGVYLNESEGSELTNCTITNNTGGGLAVHVHFEHDQYPHSPEQKPTIKNCIVHGNVKGGKPSDIGPNPKHMSNLATITDTLIGAAEYPIVGSGVLYGADPKLGPLQDNGGPAMTRALLDGSPCIAAGAEGSNLGASTREKR